MKALNKEREIVASGEHELQYARKSYRYLRIALVSMVGAILVAVLAEILDSGELLGSFSAYYYTPVHAVFIGWLVLTGICMIAIRGLSDPEDIALNIAGLCAPIVAFVPTDFPDNETTYPNLIADSLPVRAFAFNSAIAFLFAGVCSIALSIWLKRRHEEGENRLSFEPSTIIGFTLAGAVVIVLIGTYGIWGPKEAHAVAAAGLIISLWFVATANGVRNFRDKDGKRTWRHHLDVGASGAAFLFFAAMTISGLFRFIYDNDPVPLIVGAAVTTLVVGFRRAAIRKFLSPPADELEMYDRTYRAIACLMAIGAPLIAFLPDGFEHRTFWVELVELVPFGIFWIAQTIEHWHPETT